MKYQSGDIVRVYGFDSDGEIIKQRTGSETYLVYIEDGRWIVPESNIIAKRNTVRQEAIEKEMEMIQERIEKLMEKKKRLHLELSMIS